MADVTVANTAADLSANTLETAEGASTVTGLKTFDRDPNPPFAVSSGSAVVANLDADKLDGQDAPSGTIVGTSDAQTLTNKTLTSPVMTSPSVTSGAIDLQSGQITFPATQAASADANTLDDYEEGSWTPSLGGSTSESGQVYSVQIGRYTKIGRMVYVSGQITLSTLGTITGNVQIKGLPFTSAATGAGLDFPFYSALTSTVYSLSGLIIGASTTANIYKVTGAAVSKASMTQADLSNTSNLFFWGQYSV